MKKTFILFLLILNFFSVNAYTYQMHTTLKSSVAKITLDDALISAEGGALYKFFGSLDPAGIPTTEYLFIEDISKKNITVYFKIRQVIKTRTNESIKFLVEADKLRLVDSSSTFDLIKNPISTTEPIISNINCLKSDALNINFVSEACNKIQFVLRYRFGKIVENTDLIFFTSTWRKEEDLIPGIYISNVVLSYIVN